MRARSAVGVGIAALSLCLAALPAQAEQLQPGKLVCSNGAQKYACLTVAKAKTPAGRTVVFTGNLSPAAMKNLASWTAGSNSVCLDRFETSPAADGSWRPTTLEGACAQVRSNGRFTIKAEFGRVGTYYYGLTMGPCRSSAAECGNGDPDLVGVAGPTVVQHQTMP